MKKKNLIILLFIPFLIALLGVVTINTTFSFIDNDIVGIKWDYQENMTFEVRDALYLLKAEGINEKNYPAGRGNNLIWRVANKDTSITEPLAEIVESGGNYYLKTLNPGEIIVTCSNEKGNVFKNFIAILFTKGTNVITINTIITGSQQNIDNVTYYGEYDLKDHKKVKASFDIKVTLSQNDNTRLYVSSTSDNVTVDLNAGKVYINGINTSSKMSYFTISGEGGTLTTIDKTYSFRVVEDGVNVYTYDDLLDCTNRSDTGEIVVLRKSFESYETFKTLKDTTNNVVCFGEYKLVKVNTDEEKAKFDFTNDIYRFTTTYNKNYINQWNEYIKSKKGTNFVDDKINVGLHVQKDFYGNGYTINMHNLTYPSEVREEGEGNDSVLLPVLGKDDLFRGPLPFYALGDHNNMPLVEAYGQDNIGMYVDGNNITINDVKVKNCNLRDMIKNLDTVGTVLEINGDNNTVKNAVLSNGKTVLRCFSSMNTKVNNSLLENSRNFLMSIGTNEYIAPSEENEEFLAQGNEGDKIVTSYLVADFPDKAKMKAQLLGIQKSLNDERQITELPLEERYKGTMEVTDTFFYRSGIASISLDTMFNGPFLYSSIPSQIAGMLSMVPSKDGTNLADLLFKHIGGMSYPIKLVLKGNTKFYDYKTIDEMDINGLIKENISDFVRMVKPDYAGFVTIDKIFPIKSYLFDAASSKYTSAKDGKTYINVPIAYYGGGSNLSTVDISELNNKEMFKDTLTIDFLEQYLNLKQSHKNYSSIADLVLACVRDNDMNTCKNIVLKSVTVVTGYEPFKFMCTTNDGYLLGESPNVKDLIENAKGE